MKVAEASATPEEPPQEMGELVESDQELYGPDDEDDKEDRGQRIFVMGMKGNALFVT